MRGSFHGWGRYQASVKSIWFIFFSIQHIYNYYIQILTSLNLSSKSHTAHYEVRSSSPWTTAPKRPLPSLVSEPNLSLIRLFNSFFPTPGHTCSPLRSPLSKTILFPIKCPPRGERGGRSFTCRRLIKALFFRRHLWHYRPCNLLNS